MELHNSYRSRSKSFGVSAGATVGYGHKLQMTENGGSILAGRSNLNTDETIYHNGNFTNVDEVHNNTGTMIIRGFNQEGGKVTGNIGTVENTGAVIGKEENSTFKIDTYVGKDIQNYDTMTTTGVSVGTSLGKSPRVTNIGFNQEDKDKQGVTRNTVVGNVEIEEAEGSPINRDLGKANEVTKDTHSRTNINVESQTIEYLTNLGKLKEDIGKAKEEINDIKWAIKESIHDRGDDNRNFFG